MGDTFSGLEAFVLASDEKSFSRGAERLGVSPAAISKAISRLEDDLGVKLLDRTTRKVALTGEGEIYLEHCRVALAEVSRGRQRVEQARSVPEGTLVVAVPTALGNSLVRRLPEFVAAYPALRLRLVFSDRVSPHLDEQTDIALRVGSAVRASADATELCQLRWATVGSRGYLSSRGEPQCPADLLEHECLVYRSPQGSEVGWTFLEQPSRGETRTVSPPARLSFDDPSFLLEAALSGLGVAQVFSHMVDRELGSGVLIEVMRSYAAPSVALSALSKPGHASIAKVRAFLDFIREQYRKRA